MTLAVVVLQISSCLGFGALVLKVLRLSAEFSPGEQAMFSFAIGFGVLGWLVFPLGIAGLLADGWLFGLLLFGLPGLLVIKIPSFLNTRPDLVGWLLISLIGVAAVFDIAEAMAPPGDADTLAYHFNAPKMFLKAAGIDFILRPLDGAIPYLVQMTYVPALGLGGESALTLWTMVSGWAAAGLLFVLCRHHLNRNWSLAVTALFFTTPVVVYAAGTGQVEIRTALFVMVGAWAIAKSLETDKIAFTVLAGLVIGFYGGSKYIGLMFALAGGLVILMQRRWLVHGLVYTVTAFVIGSQWYIWNAIHTGDPFFPMLFQWLGRDDLVLWTKAQDLAFKEIFLPIDSPAPRNLFWLFYFPFAATLDPFTAFEAKRAGLGPYGLLILPMAAMGAWKFRSKLLSSRITTYAALTFLFYAIWFISGASQRVRHLLPVLPLFLLCISVAAQRFAMKTPHQFPLYVAVAATLVLYMGGSTLFSLKYIRHLASNDSREDFLHKNISQFAPVPWINANLEKTDRLLEQHRQLFYYLEIPYMFKSPHTQAIIDLASPSIAPKKLYSQLYKAKITHLTLDRQSSGGKPIYLTPYDTVYRSGCLSKLKSFHVQLIGSRTLPTKFRSTKIVDLMKLGSRDCLE
jgi:hypothetical protein